MAYCLSADNSRTPIHAYNRVLLADNALHINTPINTVIIAAPVNYAETNAHTCVRVNTICKFIYAENVDIDIRVPPRRLVCRNCIVRLPALYAGVLLSIKNCTISCNSAIATSTTILKNSKISGIIISSSLRYSNIANNMYTGYFAFNTLPRQYKFTQSATTRLYILILKDTVITGRLSLVGLPNILYINIARSAFQCIDDSPTLRYLDIRHCDIALGAYPALEILDARYATYTGTVAPTVFDNSATSVPEYIRKYTIMRAILKECAHTSSLVGGLEYNIYSNKCDEVADNNTCAVSEPTQQ